MASLGGYKIVKFNLCLRLSLIYFACVQIMIIYRVKKLIFLRFLYAVYILGNVKTFFIKAIVDASFDDTSFSLIS